MTTIVAIDWPHQGQSTSNPPHIKDNMNLDSGIGNGPERRKGDGNDSSSSMEKTGSKDNGKQLNHNDNYDDLARTLQSTATDKQQAHNGNDVEIQDMVYSRFDTITGNETSVSSSASWPNPGKERPSTVPNNNSDFEDVVQELKDNNRLVHAFPSDHETIEKGALFVEGLESSSPHEDVFSNAFSNEATSVHQQGHDLPPAFHQEWQDEWLHSDPDVNDWQDDASNEVLSPHLVYVLRPLDLSNDLAVNDIAAAQRTSSGLLVPQNVELIDVARILREADENPPEIRIRELSLTEK